MAAAKIILNIFGKINKLNIALVSQPIAKKKGETITGWFINVYKEKSLKFRSF